MKKAKLQFLLIFFAILLVSGISCTKEDDTSANVLNARKAAIVGTWKIKALTLAYPIRFAGQNLPVGFDIYSIAPLLPVSGEAILCSKENSYTFEADKTYSISGCTELIFPGSEASGNWDFELNGGILKLSTTGDEMAPYLTTGFTSAAWTISNTLFVAEANAAVPVNIVLEK